MEKQYVIKLVLKHLNAHLGTHIFGSFRAMHEIRTNPEREAEIKEKIEWVHALTARGSYKKAGEESDDNTSDNEGGEPKNQESNAKSDNNNDTEDGEPKKQKPKKQKSKAKKQKREAVKQRLIPQSLVEAYENKELTPNLDWYHYFNELQKYKEKHGNYKVSPTSNFLLHQWMENQRKDHQAKTLKDNRCTLLVAIKFPFGPNKNEALTASSDWSRFYKELRKYHTEHGHVWIASTQNELLYNWAQEQRLAFREKTLSEN